MQRHDHGILRRGAGGGNERKELRCRNCTHVANFLSSSSFEQGKKANESGSEYFIVLCGSIFIGRPRSMSSTLRHVYDFPKLWFGQRHD